MKCYKLPVFINLATPCNLRVPDLTFYQTFNITASSVSCCPSGQNSQIVAWVHSACRYLSVAIWLHNYPPGKYNYQWRHLLSNIVLCSHVGSTTACDSNASPCHKVSGSDTSATPLSPTRTSARARHSKPRPRSKSPQTQARRQDIQVPLRFTLNLYLSFLLDFPIIYLMKSNLPPAAGFV